MNLPATARGPRAQRGAHRRPGPELSDDVAALIDLGRRVTGLDDAASRVAADRTLTPANMTKAQVQ
jgi:hypothetical protein